MSIWHDGFLSSRRYFGIAHNIIDFDRTCNGCLGCLAWNRHSWANQKPAWQIRLAAHFGIFQSGMTALGWLAGETIVNYVEEFDHWIAFALLAYVGINLIRAGLSKGGKAFEQDPSTGRTLVILSFATSIDAFAVGLSIAFLKVQILLSIIMIGTITLILSAAGLFAGIHLGKSFGKQMEILGGVILIGIGIRVVLTHIFK